MFDAREIRVAMAKLNLTISDVAEKTGIHRVTVGAIVNDRAAVVKMETLAKIAAAVGLEVTVQLHEVETV